VLLPLYFLEERLGEDHPSVSCIPSVPTGSWASLSHGNWPS